MRFQLFQIRSLNPILLTAVLNLSSNAYAANSRCEDVFSKSTAKIIGASSLLIDHVDALKQHEDVAYRSAGFESKVDFIRQIEVFGPEGQRIIRILEDDSNLEIVTSHPEYYRNKIIKNGFLNAHQTGRDTMGYSPEGRRTRVEASYLGLSEVEYRKFPANEKPKYGIVRPSRDSGVKPSEGGMHFGEDHYIFKDEVRRNVTFFIGDSGFDVRSEGRKPWYDRALPWSARYLAAPFIIPGFRLYGSLSVMPGTVREYENWFANSIDVGPISEILQKMNFKRDIEGDYLEVQIFKNELSLDDVKIFEYEETPPSGKFLRALQSRGIIIKKIN
jgi:hypothetical protein